MRRLRREPGASGHGSNAPGERQQLDCRSDEDRGLRQGSSRGRLGPPDRALAGAGRRVRGRGPPRRIDASTMRLERSGEATLNAFDVNAVEEALRVKEAGGGDAEVV